LIRANNHQYPERKYLYFMHGNGRDCYIGRARTTRDVMRELSAPGSEERYEKVLLAMTTDLRNWINSYSPNTAVRVSVLSAGLSRILAKHGLLTGPEISPEAQNP